MCTENPEQAHPLRESRSGLPGAGRGVRANVEYQFGVNILELDRRLLPNHVNVINATELFALNGGLVVNCTSIELLLLKSILSID